MKTIKCSTTEKLVEFVIYYMNHEQHSSHDGHNHSQKSLEKNGPSSQEWMHIAHDAPIGHAGHDQKNPVLASDQPFGPYFDASLVWDLCPDECFIRA